MVDRIPIEFDVTLTQQQLARDTKDIVRKIRAVDRAFARLSPKGISRLDREMKKATLTTARLDREVRSATSATSNLGRQAQLTAKRFLIYNVIARFFFALANAIQEGTQAFIAFDAELNKARQILNPLITDFDEFTKSIFELANAFGVTIKEVQAAQEVFIRQGKSQVQVTELTRQSLSLAAAAGIEFAQATEAITASLNQFTSEGLLAVDVADKFTAVSIRNAVTADDLAQAIFRAGSAASTVGVEFDNLIGFITAAQEATRRGGRVIGTGLRTIFTRIFRAPSIEAIQELGIEVRKASGEFKNADQLITLLAEKFQFLSQTQQISIASTIAGQRQVATFLALLRNFASAQDAAADSLNSQGEAARLTRIRQEALSVQIQKISNQFVKFGVAVGNAISGEIINDVRGIADTFAVFGAIIEKTAPILNVLASSLSTVGIILVAQLLGLGKTKGAFESYRNSVKVTKSEVDAFKKSTEGAAQAGNRLQRAFSSRRAAGPTKQFEADAAAFRLAKLKNTEERNISRTKAGQLELIKQGEILERQVLIITLNKTAAERANFNVQKGLRDREAEKLKLGKAQLQVAQLLRDIKPNQQNLINLKEEGRQIRQNLKNRRAELEQVVGSRGQGRGRGREGLAQQGLLLERDRIKVAQELLVIEDKIAKLKTTSANASGRTALQQARSRQLLEKKLGERSVLTSKLRKSATEQELKLVRAIARERLKLANVARKRGSANNALAKQEQGVAAAKQQVLTIEQEIAILNTFIAETEAVIKIITLETEAAKLQVKVTTGEISALETEQLKLLNAKLKIEQAIVKQKERTEKLNIRAKNSLTTRGGGGTGLAIGLSLGLSTVSEVLRENRREGDKTTEAIAQGFDAAGGIAITAMLLPLGPLGLALITIQAVVGAMKIVNTLTADWAEETDKVNKRVDNLSNVVRGLKTVFAELAKIAGEIQLQGLSITNLSLINEQIASMRKNFQDIPTREFSRIEGSLRKAVRTNDIDRIASLREELERLAGEQIIGKNLIDRELIENTIAWRDEVVAARRALGEASAASDRFGKDIVFEDAVKRVARARGELKKLRDESKDANEALISGFLQASDASQTFGQNLVRLDFQRLVDAAGIANQLAEEFLRTKKGFDVTSSSAGSLSEAIRENADLFDTLNSNLDKSFGAVTQVQKALRETEITAGKSATVFFRVKDAINASSEEFRQFATILTEESGQGFDEGRIANTIEILKQSLDSGTNAVRAFIDEQGALSFKIDGLPGVISPASKAYGFLRKVLEENGQFAAIAENAFDSFGASQLSNSRITDLLAKKYVALARSIKGAADNLSAITNNIQKTTALNNDLAASFPERALDVNVKQLEALRQRATGLSAGMSQAINALAGLDESLNATQLTLSTQITDAFFKGGDASIDFTNRILIANNIVDDAKTRFDAFQSSVRNANFGGEQFDTFKAAALELTSELIAIEELSGAVLGLASLKEKLLADNGEILGSDIGLIIKLQEILKKGFDFKDIDFGPNILGNRDELAKEIDRIIQTLSATFRKKGEDSFGRAGKALAQALVTETQTTLSTGGDTIAKRLDTVLTTAFSKIAEKLREPVDELRESFKILEDEGVAALGAIVDAANSNISTLGQIISKGIIPPKETLTNILVGQFVQAEEASNVAIGKIQARLQELKTDRQVLAELEADIKESTKDQEGRENKIRAARDAVLAADGKILEQQTRLTAEQKKQNTLLSSLNQVLLKSIGQVDNSLKSVFDAQKAVISAESKLFTTRLSFIDIEDATLGRRLAILQLERDTFENIRRSVSGIEQTDVGAIGDKIVELSKQAVETGLEDAAAAEFIKTRIRQLQQQLNVENQIAALRVKNLQKELDLLNKQEKQITQLGLSFVKATDEQQKGIIRAARLTEKFFGGIGAGSEGPNTAQVRSSILDFLRTSGEETRQSVIGQLEQLKAAGGEVAPGVPAAKILSEMGKFIGDALFKNPQIAIAERQEQVQRDILTAQKDQNEISRVQLRVSAQTLRAQAGLAAQVTQNVVAAGGTGGEALKQVQITRQSVSQVTGAVDNLIETQKERAKQLLAEKRLTDQAAVSNKRFVDTTRKADISIQDAGLSFEEFARKSVELRNALVEADDAFIDAQQAVTDASIGVRVALTAAAKSQIDYNIGIAEANRQNLLAIGGFQTYRDELSFLNDTFNNQINTLRQIGDAEQQIAALRVQLAQQQLSVFQQQIANVRQNARALLTQEGAGLQFFQAGAAASLAADLAAQAGITPSGDVTGAQQDDLARAILSLPLEIRQDLDRAFSNAPPGQTAGDFGIGQLESIILSALGGRSDATPDLLTLEQRAAEQRTIIAENSTSQLESTRSATIAAFAQLATSQEGLMEAKANKELAKLQLDSLQNELPEQTHLLAEILRGITTLEGSVRANVSSLAQSKPAFITSAAGGTLSGTEVAGLLRAASREKSSMPGGAGLGVFNTSETVLTRKQMGRLRGSSFVPNAADGTTIIASDEVVGLLRDISARVGELKQKGVTQQIAVDITNNRRVNVEGLAGLQTALRDIIGDQTDDLYTREEAAALEQVLQRILTTLRETGQVSAIGT